MGSMGKASTRSGYRRFDNRGRKDHTYFHIPAEYGYLDTAGEPTSGSFCYNCGDWDGPKLKRGELTRMRRELLRKAE